MKEMRRPRKSNLLRERVEMIIETDRYDTQVRPRHWWVGIQGEAGKESYWECSNCGGSMWAKEKPPVEGCGVSETGL